MQPSIDPEIKSQVEEFYETLARSFYAQQDAAAILARDRLVSDLAEMHKPSSAKSHSLPARLFGGLKTMAGKALHRQRPKGHTIEIAKPIISTTPNKWREE